MTHMQIHFFPLIFAFDLGAFDFNPCMRVRTYIEIFSIVQNVVKGITLMSGGRLRILIKIFK